jgi:hypothetical protein
MALKGYKQRRHFDITSEARLRVGKARRRPVFSVPGEGHRYGASRHGEHHG